MLILITLCCALFGPRGTPATADPILFRATNIVHGLDRARFPILYFEVHESGAVAWEVYESTRSSPWKKKRLTTHLSAEQMEAIRTQLATIDWKNVPALSPYYFGYIDSSAELRIRAIQGNHAVNAVIRNPWPGREVTPMPGDVRQLVCVVEQTRQAVEPRLASSGICEEVK